MGGSDHISTGGMISTNFIVFYCFFFPVIYLFFVLFWVLYYIFFGFLFNLKCFWSHTTHEMTGPRVPPPFLVREYSVLTMLKSFSRESGRLPRCELPFRPGGCGPIKGVTLSIHVARSAR